MNKRLLISIANYGDSQLDYLEKVLDNFASYTHDVTICIDTTVDLTALIKNRSKVIQRIYPPSVGTKLPFKHRKYFAQHIENYDHFLYTENDHLIPQKAIDYIVSASSDIESDEIIGFVRFETKNNVRYINDFDIAHPISESHAWQQSRHIFFSPYNFHSGCYLLSKEQLYRAISSGGYLVSPHVNPYGMLEQAASDIYTQCGFKQKLLPLPIDPVLIQHMPNKYISMNSALPSFNLDALSVLEKKLSDKPKLKTMSPPSILKRLLINTDYKAKLLERRIRHYIRGKH